MREKRKIFIMGFLSAVIVLALAIPVLAAGNMQTWNDVLVGGITITLDGETIQPKDANGNPVEPAIYDGTTYLPVRAIADALGMEVAWDGSTKTVILKSAKNQEPAPAPVQPTPTQDETLGQKNAVAKAKDYLDFMAFSRKGLIEQLEFEKFSHEEAVYGVDHCGADWFEQKNKKAESYLEYMSFSREGLIEQLEFEGFTHEEAVYGVESVGY